MNSVLFDQLGPGQSGRLAYQVMGQNGPIFNPNNIRYLPPDSPEIPANAMSMGSSSMAGLAGANLIASFLTLGVSVYIAHRINSLHQQMDHLLEITNRMEQKIDYIVTKVDRIDIQVAENNLRHALNYVLQQAVSPEGVDLRVLGGFSEDISVFGNSLRLISNFSLRLSSDIRGQLQQIYDLLYSIRKLVVQRYNISVEGDPERVVAITPTLNYFEPLGHGRPLGTMVTENMLFEKALEQLAIHKKDMLGFTFFSEQEFSECEDGHRDRLVELFYNAGFVDLRPDGLFLSDLFMDEADEAVWEGLYDLCCAWLYNTDAGLLWRTWIELYGIANGYENYFWPQLKEAEPCGFNQIDVACEVPQLENA